MPPPMEEYWKDDFRPLRDSAKQITQAMIADEKAQESDLYRRIASTRKDGSSQQTLRGNDLPVSHWHAYHSDIDEKGMPPALFAQHVSSFPLPDILMQAKQRVKHTMFMGVLPALSWGYLAVDSTIYLFSLDWRTTGTPETLLSYVNPRGQSILAAQLVKPRPGMSKHGENDEELFRCFCFLMIHRFARPLGIFKSIVEYCLVVTTVEDAWLLALRHDGKSGWNCVPTSFVVPSDSVRFTCIAGTETGRIFLGGDDGCLHEFVYEDTTSMDRNLNVEEQLESFYDGTKELPEVVTEKTGKRSWLQAMLSSSSVTGELPRKCRKFNRTRPPSSWLTSGGSSYATGRVQQVVVDDERRTLSLLTTKGFLQVYDLRKDTSTHLSASCHVPATAKLYLDAASRGQLSPPPKANCRFAGGVAAAQAGVGGMSGARELRNAMAQSEARGSRGPSILTPVKLHVIPCSDSAHISLLAVTHSGLRLYFSTLDNSALNVGAVQASQASAPARSNNLSPLGPASFVTLCHIRAPPTLLSQTPVAIPNVKALSSWKVDASFHKQGQWLVAMEQTTNKGKDVVLSVMPDSLKRPLQDEHKLEMEESAGLAETVVVPSEQKTLVGGLVWDFCELPSGESDAGASSVAVMLSRSPIFSNVNDQGIPPAYDPPSKSYSSSSATSHRQVVPSFHRASLGPAGVHIMCQALSNFIFSRPVSHGLPVPALTNGNAEGQHRIESGNDYRISKRTGVRSFSATAQERATSRSSTGTRGNNSRSASSSRRTSGISSISQSSSLSLTRAFSRRIARSARLREELLRPMTIPLQNMATQHLATKPTEIVALNAMGVHVFTVESILSKLAKALMSAGETVKEDRTIHEFFQRYGFVEGCAMSMALAIQTGPSDGRVRYTEDLRKLAEKAVMARGGSPTLKISASGIVFGSDIVVADSSADPFVPPGYVFHPSSLSQGLTRLFARLVRPIWAKPMVVVSEGPEIKLTRSPGNRSTPAKVEFLFDEEALQNLVAPLQSLQGLVKEFFKRAIDQPPGTVQRESMMDIDDGLNLPASSFLTQAMHYNSNARTGNAGATVELNQKEAVNIAHLIEERNIHSLYRLLSRVVQLLRLISLLRKADSMPELPQVEWGLLHGLTVLQLVQSPEGQDRIETLLNNLVVTSAANESSLSYSSSADNIAHRLADLCYLYFPPSSRFTYQGIRYAIEALACDPSSSRRLELKANAATDLGNAAKHWYSPTLISGSLLRSRGGESNQDIVARALRHGSPLATAADLLIQLGDAPSVVEICLLTADNFRRQPSITRSRVIRDREQVLSWERDLYHKNREELQNNLGGNNSSPGASDSFGASVSEKDAIDTCYAIILHHLSRLLVSDRVHADKMISACASYTDKEFLQELFKFLLDNNHADVLVRINSIDAEKFLREHDDPDLLWRYFDVQGKHSDSAKVSIDRATKEDQVPIEERIEWLTRASNSLKKESKNTSWQTEHSLNFDVIPKLNLAKIQHRCLQAIDSLPERPTTITEEDWGKIRTSLMDVSDLYKLAAGVPLADMCLVIMHSCRSNETQTIEMLWKTLLSEKLFPAATHSSKVYDSLKELATIPDSEFDPLHLIDVNGVSKNRLPLFEKGGWIQNVESTIRSLGHDLYGKGADFTFPVDFLMGLLENIRKAYDKLHSPGWSMKVLAQAGVSYVSLIRSFRSQSELEQRRMASDENEAIKDALAAQLDLLAFWLANCDSTSDQAEVAKLELSGAHATGELNTVLGLLRQQIDVIPETLDLRRELAKIEDKLAYLV